MNKDFSKKVWDFINSGKQIPEMCFICGEDEPCILKKIQSHHLFGKAHSDIEIPLCLNCHAKISAKQNRVSPKKRSNKASKLEKIGYILLTHGKLQELVGKKNQEIGMELLENG